MRIIQLPQVEIVTISKVVKLEEITSNDDDVSEETLRPGTYALDSLGQIWCLMPEISDLFLGFDAPDPQLRAERRSARVRTKRTKRKPMKVRR